MAPPVGQWDINGNGTLGKLIISAVDAGGNLTASVYEQPVVGFWNENSQQITFIRVLANADPAAMQVYSGYLIQDALPFLAGSFTAFGHAGGQVRRSEFGWRAVSLGVPGPLDLVWAATDDNGLPKNPRWWWQLTNPGQVPDPDQVCPGGFAVPCTNQAPTQNLPDGTNGIICRLGGAAIPGHVNWMGVTYEGTIFWQEHSSDDDYNFLFTPQDNLPDANLAGLTTHNENHQLALEFDSDETIDHIDSPWWNQFHHAVDHNNQMAHDLVDNRFAVVTGMFGLDCEHGCKSEVHPVWAIAIRVRDADPNDEVWAVFVRNWGDEGFCSSVQEILHLPGEDHGQGSFTFRLPWRPGSAQVATGAATQFFSNSNDPRFSFGVTPVGGEAVLITFTLPPPDFDPRPLVFGEIHFQWA